MTDSIENLSQIVYFRSVLATPVYFYTYLTTLISITHMEFLVLSALSGFALQLVMCKCHLNSKIYNCV